MAEHDGSMGPCAACFPESLSECRACEDTDNGYAHSCGLSESTGFAEWVDSIEDTLKGPQAGAQRCTACNGWGDERGAFRYCTACNGTGRE